MQTHVHELSVVHLHEAGPQGARVTVEQIRAHPVKVTVNVRVLSVGVVGHTAAVALGPGIGQAGGIVDGTSGRVPEVGERLVVVGTEEASCLGVVPAADVEAASIMGKVTEGGEAVRAMHTDQMT